jgi:hypothetical protein
LTDSARIAKTPGNKELEPDFGAMTPGRDYLEEAVCIKNKK